MTYPARGLKSIIVADAVMAGLVLGVVGGLASIAPGSIMPRIFFFGAAPFLVLTWLVIRRDIARWNYVIEGSRAALRRHVLVADALEREECAHALELLVERRGEPALA